MRSAAQIVHKENPSAVIFLSGLGYDTDLSIVTAGKFDINEWPAHKTALELHRYDSKTSPTTNCNSIQTDMDRLGWEITKPGHVKTMPVVMTEFGFAQSGNTFQGKYAQCLKSFFETRRTGWIYWVLAGSYYIRSGKQDFDEPWGR